MLVSVIKTAIEQLRQANIARYNSAMEKECYSRFDKRPTIDCEGRLHAPVDNYLWIDGISYLGGQYLPDPYADKFDLFDVSKTLTYKLKVTKSAAIELAKFLSGSNGKHWLENDIEVCYYYAIVSKSEYNLLANLIPQTNYKKVVLVSEHGNPDNQKTWKFSSKKIWRKVIDSTWDFDFFAPGVEYSIDQSGNITSPFDKQLVRYQYFTPELITL